MTPAPNVVDSSGWLEYLADGPDAARFAEPLAQPETLIVSSLSVYEVFKRVLQQRDETAALQAAALMQQGKVVDLDAGLAIVAAKLSLDLKLPMADAVILATAGSAPCCGRKTPRSTASSALATSRGRSGRAPGSCW